MELLNSNEHNKSSSSRFLTFRIDTQLFGLPISEVVQITKIQTIFTLPQQPVYVEGIINLRGQIIPVINGRLRFGKENVPFNERTCIIIVHAGVSEFGLIVDEVDEVADIPADQIEAPPKLDADLDSEGSLICGVAKTKAAASQKDRIALIIRAANILEGFEFTSPESTDGLA